MSLHPTGRRGARGSGRRRLVAATVSSIPQPGPAPVPECEIDWPTINRLRAEAEREYALADAEQRDAEAFLALESENYTPARLFVSGPDEPDAQPWTPPAQDAATAALPVIGAATRAFEVTR